MDNLNPQEKSNTAFSIFPFFNTRQPGFIIVLLAIIFYAPSLNNEYALDDGIIIHQNNYVLKGAGGIREILTHDAYDAFYKRMNAKDQLQGGRYRPLPVITYALEQQIIAPYRSGYYMMAEDLNKNGFLDHEEVTYTNFAGQVRRGYEYNSYVDLNGDDTAQVKECYYCWDLNKNFQNDRAEDLNADGIFNEVDCQVNGARLRHFNNIVFFAICCLLVFRLFSRHFFPHRQDLAFLAALIFTVHPVLSEAVANIKGREDIFSMIFIALTFMGAFRYIEKKQLRHLVLAAIAMFAALMSKEYALALYLLLPLSLFVLKNERLATLQATGIQSAVFLLSSLFLIFCDLQAFYFGLAPWLFFLIAAVLYTVITIALLLPALRKRSSPALLPMLFLAGIIYLSLRLNAVNMAPGVPDTEILNNPYLLATGSQAFATKIYTLLLYLRIYFFPHPLLSDYSYATITYRDALDWEVIVSLLLNSILLMAGIILCIRRHIAGLALVTWFVFILSTSNLFFYTGTMMLETHLLHPSLGMSVVVAWLILRIIKIPFLRQPALARTGLIFFLLLVTVVFAIKARNRSRDWKNDVTLFLRDVKYAPNSVLVLGNAGARWIDLADTREITGKIIPGSDSTLFNDYNGQLVISDEEVKSGGYKDKREAALQKGIAYLEHAVELHPRYVNGFLNLGLAHYKLGDHKKAILNWKFAEALYPDNPYLRNYYYVFSQQLRESAVTALNKENYHAAESVFKKLLTINPKNAEDAYQLGAVYFNMGCFNLARKYWNLAGQVAPEEEKYKKGLQLLPEKGKKGC